MRILKNSFWIGLLLISGCGRELTDDFIPITSFPDIILQLNLPENNSLQVDGGHRQLSTGGIRELLCIGLILQLMWPTNALVHSGPMKRALQ